MRVLFEPQRCLRTQEPWFSIIQSDPYSRLNTIYHQGIVRLIQ